MLHSLPPRWLLAVWLLAPAVAMAQEPDVRMRLDSLRAAILPISDSLALLSRERERMAAARASRDDPLLHMELGLLAFRLGEVTGATQRYDDAAGEFEWAAELRPGWPYAWHWLGLAELAVGEHRAIAIENIRQLLGIDALSKAVRAFTRAVEADPAFSAALVELAATTLRQRISPRTAVAQRALRAASETPAGRVPSVLLMRGRVERELGEHDSALASFRAFVDAGGDRGRGGLEVARSLAALGRPDSAVAAYFRAARLPATDSARRAFRGDVAWIATAGELAALDSAPADSFGQRLERFWGTRDAEAGRRRGERLLEHFRRQEHARANYRLVSRHRRYDITDVLRDTTQREFDDRGLIYLRHGEPDRRATYTGAQVEPNESWLYARTPPERDLIFHFVAREDVQDYKLVESVLDVLGFSAAIAAQTRLEAPPGSPAAQRLTGAGAAALAQALLTSRSELSPLYERLARGGAAGRNAQLAEEREQGRRSARVGAATDSYPLRFAADLRPVVSSFFVADAALRPELHVVFALPASRLHPVEAAGGGIAYPLALRVVVFGEGSVAAAELDTLRVFRSPRPLGEGAFLTERVALRVPAGRHRYRFVVEEPHAGAGAVAGGEPFEVPALEGGFAASDLVLGREGSGLVWRRAEGDVPLNPLQRFPVEGAAILYYEVYGLPQGASVLTRVSVRSAGSRSIFRRIFGGGGAVELAYATVTDAPGRARVRQRLELRGLPAGRYVVELTLEDPLSGRSVARRQSFDVTRAP